MGPAWCSTCCTSHALDKLCPGELPATGPERHGWRVNVDTPSGIEAYGVLVAESHDVWRARILTYPNVLWLVPGGHGSLKFVGDTAQEAERKASGFVREFCRKRRYRVRHEVAIVNTDGVIHGSSTVHEKQAAMRKIRFIPVRFGVARASELGGTGNLSETGLFVITDSPVDIGAMVSLSLMLEHDAIPLRGEVRWAMKHHHAGRAPGMGIRLEAPPDPYLQYVRTLPL